MTQPTIKPPYAAHTTVAKDRRHLAEEGWYAPDFILVKVTQPKAPDWDELDDLLRSICGDDRVAVFPRERYHVARGICLEQLVNGFGDKADRLEFRRLPERPA